MWKNIVFLVFTFIVIYNAIDMLKDRWIYLEEYDIGETIRFTTLTIVFSTAVISVLAYAMFILF